MMDKKWILRESVSTNLVLICKEKVRISNKSRELAFWHSVYLAVEHA